MKNKLDWKVAETEDGMINVYMAGSALKQISAYLSCLSLVLLAILIVLITLTITLAIKL